MDLQPTPQAFSMTNSNVVLGWIEGVRVRVLSYFRTIVMILKTEPSNTAKYCFPGL